MAQCQTCKTSGPNMKQCEKCKNIWCITCASSGKGPYPKTNAVNKCPYCGAFAVKMAP
jgi:hypothetical protein